METSVVVAILTGLFSTVGIIVKIVGESKVKRKKEITDKPLFVGHHIFTRLEILKRHINVNFELQNKGKEVIFKDLLTKTIDIWIGTAKEMAVEFDKSPEESNDPTNLYNLIIGYFEQGIADTGSYYKQNCYSQEEQEVMRIVMNKFNRWNSPRLDSTHDTLRMVCNSQFYDNDKIKMAIALDILLSMLLDTINDAEATLNEINGDLKGLTFRGVTV